MSAAKRTRSWPVLLLTLPAFVAIWGGWVGLGGMTGFGVINLLPGMVNDGGWATVNTAVTLPIGLETYAAYALHAYTQARTEELKRFAGRSAIVALVLGGSGQLAYHVMESLGVVNAPWWITAIVATIPVAVLGAGTRLSSLIRSDAPAEQPPIVIPITAQVTEQSDVADLATGTVPGQGGSQPAPVRQPDTRPVLVHSGSGDTVAVGGATPRGRAPRGQTDPALRDAVLALVDDRSPLSVKDAAEKHGVARSTLGRYGTLRTLFRNEPQADVPPALAGKVRTDLVAIVRDAMNRERAL